MGWLLTDGLASTKKTLTEEGRAGVIVEGVERIASGGHVREDRS